MNKELETMNITIAQEIEFKTDKGNTVNAWGVYTVGEDGSIVPITKMLFEQIVSFNKDFKIFNIKENTLEELEDAFWEEIKAAMKGESTKNSRITTTVKFEYWYKGVLGKNRAVAVTVRKDPDEYYDVIIRVRKSDGGVNHAGDFDFEKNNTTIAYIDRYIKPIVKIMVDEEIEYGGILIDEKENVNEYKG